MPIPRRPILLVLVGALLAVSGNAAARSVCKRVKAQKAPRQAHPANPSCCQSRRAAQRNMPKLSPYRLIDELSVALVDASKIGRLRRNEVIGFDSLVNPAKAAETTALLERPATSITSLRRRSMFLLDIDGDMAAHQVADNCRRKLASLRRSDPQLYIIATFPVGKSHRPLNPEITMLDEAIADIARLHNLIVIDPKPEDESLRENFSGAGFQELREGVAPHVTEGCGGNCSATRRELDRGQSKWVQPETSISTKPNQTFEIPFWGLSASVMRSNICNYWP